MPNGHTQAVADGTTTWTEFIKDCARGFGFAVLQRDEGRDVPLKTHYEPSDYHQTGLREAEEAHARAVAMTELEAERLALKAFETGRLDYAARVRKAEATAARYDRFIALTLEWDAPPELAEMKSSILGWLREGREWDSKVYGEAPTQVESGRAYREKLIAHAADEIAYHQKGYAEEVARTNGRNHYLRLLMESLGEGVPG